MAGGRPLTSQEWRNSVPELDSYITKVIFNYCDEKKSNDEQVTANGVLKDNEDLWYIIATMYYGQWIRENSDFVSEEFSKGNFDMIEYNPDE